MKQFPLFFYNWGGLRIAFVDSLLVAIRDGSWSRKTLQKKK